MRPLTRSVVASLASAVALAATVALPAGAQVPSAGPATATMSYVSTGLPSTFLLGTRYSWSAVTNATSYNIRCSIPSCGQSNISGTSYTVPSPHPMGPLPIYFVSANLPASQRSTETAFVKPQGNFSIYRFLFSEHVTTLLRSESADDKRFSDLLAATYQSVNACGDNYVVSFKVTGYTDGKGSADSLHALALARAKATKAFILAAAPNATVTVATSTAQVHGTTSAQTDKLSRSTLVQANIVQLQGQRPNVC